MFMAIVFITTRLQLLKMEPKGQNIKANRASLEKYLEKIPR
jgi:hypothetical protein